MEVEEKLSHDAVTLMVKLIVVGCPSIARGADMVEATWKTISEVVLEQPHRKHQRPPRKPAEEHRWIPQPNPNAYSFLDVGGSKPLSPFTFVGGFIR